MVNKGVFMGGILYESRNPAKILPNSKRLIEFISWGLFSLIEVSEENRGCPIRAKKIIRVL